MKLQNPWNKRNFRRFSQNDFSPKLIKRMERTMHEICNPWYKSAFISFLQPGQSNLPFGLDIPVLPYV